jgi:hypothetical protein
MSPLISFLNNADIYIPDNPDQNRIANTAQIISDNLHFCMLSAGFNKLKPGNYYEC